MRLDPPYWTFEGLAHSRLFVVRHGARIDDALEVMRPSAALAWLSRWLVDPTAQRELLGLHRALYGGLETPGWGLSDGASSLGPRLSRALEFGDLLILQPRIDGAAAVEEVGEPLPSSGSEEKPERRGDAFIEIELFDPAGIPFKTPLRFTPPSSATESLRFDGFIRIEALPEGMCDIAFPQIDGREWGPVPGGPGSGLRTGFVHPAGPGECVSSIARRFGFACWRTVYDDPNNAELRRLRPNPNVLARGDAVFVPDPDPRVEESVTNRRAIYHTTATPTRLRIRFEGQGVNDYELRVAGRVIQGVVAPGGMIDEVIPADATAGQLTLRPHDVPGQLDSWTIQLGGLDPVSELSGIQARLENLGFACAVDNEQSAETTRAVAAYQRWRHVGDGLGTVDDATRNDLQAFHDG